MSEIVRIFALSLLERKTSFRLGAVRSFADINETKSIKTMVQYNVITK